MTEIPPATILPKMVEQHAEEAAFLRLLRCRRLGAYDLTFASLRKLDDRQDANLDGLRAGGDAAWEVCETVYRDAGAPESFVTAVLAMEGEHDEVVAGLVAATADDPARRSAFVSALGWTSEPAAARWTGRLVGSADPAARRVGLAGASVRRTDVGKPLREALGDGDPWLHARAARAAGEFGLLGLAPGLRDGLAHSDDAVRIWSARSLSLLTGERRALDILRAHAIGTGPLARVALETAVRRMPLSEALVWVKSLRSDPSLARLALAAAAALGHPENVPWLLECVAVPALAKPAGEAFVAITGVDLRHEGLLLDAPAAVPADDDDAPDSTPEDDLPVPDPSALARWWSSHRSRFTPARYILGGPHTPERLTMLLGSTRQPYRVAAALELSVAEPGRPLFETRAPARVQRRLLV